MRVVGAAASTSLLPAVVVLASSLLMLLLGCGMAAATTTPAHCDTVFNKVTACLGYATGKSPTPTKECCAAVTDIRNTDPACLCYIIQQTHSGSEQIKDLGIQEARLIQLPTACSLKNSSISDCPRLLNIPPGSPDYAIFAGDAPASAPAALPGTTPAGNDSVSRANLADSYLVTIAVQVIAAVFLYTFPAGVGRLEHVADI